MVIIATALYSFSQQQSSGKIFKSFRNMIPQETLVLRDGQQKRIPADQLVLGDVVMCRGGERIPADIRIIHCEGMKVDNSSLTGESEPQSRSTEASNQAVPLEARNIAFFSTSCVDGNGIGLVIAIGDQTVMGKIAKLVTNIEQRDSPIQVEISRFVNIIAVISFAEGIIYFAICMALGIEFFESFIFMISIIVGNIPEGLLPAMTLGLTLTAKRMARKNCMIKYLEAVETLGSTSTICSDKTGTLTENRMTVEHCYIGNKIVQVSHEPEELAEDIRQQVKCWPLYERCAMLCSRAYFINQNDEDRDIMKREASGDASELAILRFMESVIGGINTELECTQNNIDVNVNKSIDSVENYRRKYPKVAEKPFSSVYKYQYSIHYSRHQSSSPEQSKHFLVMKGAPERIIRLCSRILNEQGETVELMKHDIDAFEAAYRELGSMGERVLAFCDMDLHGFSVEHKFQLDECPSENLVPDFELKNMRFLGMIAMIDPPR